jgi:multidrug efflux pump subunit AcrA (membrane-fusion protein)
MKHFWKKYKIWIIVAIVIAHGLFFVFGGSKKQDSQTTQIVSQLKKGTIEEVVNITGRVKAYERSRAFF